MNDFVEILIFLYVVVGCLVGGLTLSNSIDDEELTKGRLSAMVIFLPLTLVMGFVFALAAFIVWIYESFKYSNNKFTEWWESPVRKKK